MQNRKLLNPLFKLVMVLIVLALLLLGVAIYLIQTDSAPLPEPLPDYPNGKLLSSSSNLSSKVPYESLGLYCTESFVGQKYKVFATSDSESQILAFYRQAASVKPNFEYEFQGVSTKDIEEGYTNPRNISGQQIICFMEKRYRNATAANVLVILDPDNQQLSKKISEISPNAPSNMRLILMIQGSIPRI